jgi:hypothetical protein
MNITAELPGAPDNVDRFPLCNPVPPVVKILTFLNPAKVSAKKVNYSTRSCE